MLRFGAADPQDVLSLQNRLNRNGSLAREEAAYLTHGNDLFTIASSDDGAVIRLEAWVENSLIRFCKTYYRVMMSRLENETRVES